MTSQTEKADAFRRLHRRGTPFALYNIWDAAGGARRRKCWRVGGGHGQLVRRGRAWL